MVHEFWLRMKRRLYRLRSAGDLGKRKCLKAFRIAGYGILWKSPQFALQRFADLLCESDSTIPTAEAFRRIFCFRALPRGRGDPASSNGWKAGSRALVLLGNFDKRRDQVLVLRFAWPRVSRGYSQRCCTHRKSQQTKGRFRYVILVSGHC
jgi:hypothetical protein